MKVEHEIEGAAPDEFITDRVKRIQMGDHQFGCMGTHKGSGKPGCPKEPHHHHDRFCAPPTPFEMLAAGVEPFEPESRA